MADIYKIAAQNQLRFWAMDIGGIGLTVEQLFQLPLKSQRGPNLDSTARHIFNELKGMTEESFVEDASANPRKTQLEVSLEIVKDVIKTKQGENAAELAKIHRTAERKKLLDAIGAKKDAALSAASLEELEKKLAELD